MEDLDVSRAVYNEAVLLYYMKVCAAIPAVLQPALACGHPCIH